MEWLESNCNSNGDHGIRIQIRIHVNHLAITIQYIQEVVTLQKKYFIYLHQKMRFTPFINDYEGLGCMLFFYRAK